MAKAYLQVAPIPGKWYVSERVQATSTGWHIIDRSQSEPKLSKFEMILAGPFDTRELAMAWNKQSGAGGYIWEKEGGTPEKSV